MRNRILGWGILALAVSFWSSAAAAQTTIQANTGTPSVGQGFDFQPSSPYGVIQTQYSPPLATLPPIQPDPLPPVTKSAVQPPAPGIPCNTCNQCNNASPCNNCACEHFTPYMLGDFIGPIGSLFCDIKVSEGNSPRPVDRFFFDANYYNNIFADRWKDPAETLKHVDYLRYVFGFEKTFLDGRASVTLRIPFFTIDARASDYGLSVGEKDFTSTDLGNISAIFKMVLMEDKSTGSLLSAGATITVPTEATRLMDPGQATLAYVAPFVGYILERGNFFLQGFTSMTLPVARPESILLFNDIGVGYFAYRNDSGWGMVRSIAPTFEVHVLTPLRQADPQQDEFGTFDKFIIHNNVDLTLGATIEFANRSTLGIGFCTPVTGPQPFDFEAIAQFNLRF
ncbi:MAG TPA: hypothetical protein VE988_12630 [Gemmataceae bacterium]|nr:hypothetical protein [Gemmataceae bacterium]